MLLRALLFLGASAVSVLGQPRPDWPEIVGVDVDEYSLEGHRTDRYRLEYGFVLRRGFPFDVIIKTSKPLRGHDGIVVLDEDGIGKFHVDKIVRHDPEDDDEDGSQDEGENHHIKYRATISTTADAPINKYENIVFYVAHMKRHGHPEEKSEEFRFEYPFPLYLIFNPYSHDDEVHFPDTEGGLPYNSGLLEEYIGNEDGLIWSGSENDHEEQKWHYGQFSQIVLDSFFQLIAGIDPSHRSSALKVGYHLSRSQGYVTSMGPAFGNPKGILEGRWSGSFDGAFKLPTDWESTIDILDAWQNNSTDHAPVKYGQCWVFAALQLSFLRAIGIPSRQIECFDGRIDKSATFYPDNQTHHVVNFYYDKNGTEVKREGHVWNFHSWNDVWVRRDRHHYSGWQALDGTPKGLGAAPARAVYDLDENYPNDTSTLISSVHATVQKFLVNCTDPEKKNCEILKRLHYEPDGVNLIVTKEPHTNAKQTITDLYVRKGVDVFDQSPHNPWKANSQDQNAVLDSQPGLQVTVGTASSRVTVGEPLTLTVRVQSQDESLPVSLGVTVDLKTPSGETVKTLGQQAWLVQPDEHATGVRMIIAVKDYVLPEMNELYVDIRAVAASEDEEIVALDHVRLPIRSPLVKTFLPPAVAVKTLDSNDESTFNADVVFENPFDFALEKVCVAASSRNLRVSDADKRRCFAMASRESVMVSVAFDRPMEEGAYSAVFTLNGAYLPTQRQSVDVHVVGAYEGMRHFASHP